MINRKITKGKKAPQTVSNFVISFFSSFFCVDVRISLIFRHTDNRATDFGILWTLCTGFGTKSGKVDTCVGRYFKEERLRSP